jgi:hypothetical protein
MLTAQSTSSLLRRAFSFYATLTPSTPAGGSGLSERAFGTPTKTSLLISAQLSRVITLQSSSSQSLFTAEAVQVSSAVSGNSGPRLWYACE